MIIAKEAIDFIVAKEVSSRQHYEAVLHRPEWPEGESGVTIGIGYDLGYATRSDVDHDWGPYLPAEMIPQLKRCCGVTGIAARDLCRKVRGSISVPWTAAMIVFMERDIPKWDSAVRKALPNYDELGLLCRGVLVSLAYNRGASFSKKGDRYEEMRAIKARMTARDFLAIPAEIESMKRLWTSPSNRGVALRRGGEAELFRKGLQQMAAASNEESSGKS